MTSETALVTGGAGFIGSALVERLVETGRDVVVLDNLSTGRAANVPPDATLIEGSTADGEIYEELPPEVSVVYHLAGQSSGEASFDDPAYDFESHVIGTFELLRWCARSEVDRVLYASSMSIYGDPDYLPVDEAHPVDPKTYYAAGKLAAEAYVNLFDNLGLDTTVLRLFSVYGPGQNLENMKQGMVSIYLSFILDEDPVLVKGELDRFRDFVFVGDVVEAFMSAARTAATHGETYNVARGEKVTVETLLETMFRAAGHEQYPIEVTDGTPGDQFGIYGDSTNLQTDVDWSPSVTLAEGLERMVAAERDREC